MATNTKWIEDSAVNALKTVLYRCPLIEPYISDNDKTPSWDGAIFVYSHPERKKEQIVGRIPVQVKGTETQIVSDIATYSCDLSDLRNYYNDGGCLYFRISVLPQAGDYTIFYSALHVYDLKKILDEAEKHQSSYTIRLNKFPSNSPEAITALCMDFVENAKKQKSIIGRELQSLDDLEQSGVKIESLSFTTTGIEFDPVKIGNYLSSHAFYLYAKPQGVNIEIPIEKVSNATLLRMIPGKVQVKETVYYSSYVVVHENGQPHLKIGKGISMVLDLENNSSNISLQPNGTLSDIIRDTKFFVAMMECQEVTINGARLHFNLDRIFDLERYHSSLRYYGDIKKMLDYFGVEKELECDALTEKDNNNIRNFVNASLYNQRIGFVGSEEDTVFGGFRIANIVFWIWGDKQDDGYYIVENFFVPHRIVIFDEKDVTHNNPIPVTQYLLMSSDAFAHASNINFEAIKKDVASMRPHPALVGKVTFMLLDVLNGYDEQEEKDTRLLDLAETINSWLSNDDNQADPQVLKLNQLQIVKRRRQFVFSERAELMGLTKSESPHIKCGAFLLLDENEEAQKCFEELTSENQEQFLLYPISHFGNLSRKG